MKTFGAFRLDPESQTLHHGDEEVALGPRAFQVLRYLVTHAGRLVPQRELLEALWGGTHVQPDVLRTYVRDLRRALGDDPVAPRFIETRPRRGYRFIAPVSTLAGVDRRLDRLDARARDVLGAASVVGLTFEAAAVAACLQGESVLLADAEASCAVAVVEDICQALTAAGDLVRIVPGTPWPARYAFVEALDREAIYAGMPAPVRAARHRWLGEWLVDASPLDPYSDEATSHLERGGAWMQAVEGLRLVAGAAVRRGAWSGAAQAMRRALDILARQQARERGPGQAVLLEDLGLIELMSGAPQQAMTTYDALALAAERRHEPEVQVRALLQLGYSASLVSAPQALRAVEQAQAILDDVSDPLARDRADMRAAFLRVWSGRWSTLERDRFRRTLDGLEAKADRTVAAFHLTDYSFLQWLSSDYQSGRRNAEQALALLERGDDVLQRLNAQLFLSWQLLFEGAWDQALRALDTAQAAAERIAYEPRAKAIPLFRAWLSLHACDFDGARAQCRLALPHYTEHPAVGAGPRICLILAGCAEVALGRVRQARTLFAEAEAHMQRRPMNMDWYWRMQLAWGRVDLALREERPEAARRHADELLAVTTVTDERTWQALAWDASARVALAARDGRRAETDADSAVRLAEAHDLPLAAWRVYATAAAVRAGRGRDSAARRLRLQGRSAAQRLAGSLDPTSPLRARFEGHTAAVLRAVPA